MSTNTEAWGDPRSRTTEWFDPMIGATAARDMTGLDYLRALADGQYPPPPIAVTLGFDVTSVEPGKVVFEATPGEFVYNPIGLVHGGFACTLLDSVVGCAVHTTLPAGVGYTSIEIKVTYLRPILASTGRVVARGWVTKPGRRVAFAEGTVEDAGGKLLASASSSVLLLS